MSIEIPAMVRAPSSVSRKRKHYSDPVDHLKLRSRRIYKQESRRDIESRLISLFDEKLRAEMEADGLAMTRVSRRKFHFLDASYFVSREGKFYRERHSQRLKRKKGPISHASKTHELVGRGFYKDVFSLDTPADHEEMVRATYRDSFSRPSIGDKAMVDFSRQHVSSTGLMVGAYTPYYSAKSEEVYRSYVMPRMDCALSDFSEKVSVTSAVAMIMQMGLGVEKLVAEQWDHPDLHLGNVLVKKDEAVAGSYRLAISDFDLIEKDESIRDDCCEDYLCSIANVWHHIKKLPETEPEQDVLASLGAWAGELEGASPRLSFAMQRLETQAAKLGITRASFEG